MQLNFGVAVTSFRQQVAHEPHMYFSRYFQRGSSKTCMKDELLSALVLFFELDGRVSFWEKRVAPLQST